MTKSIENQLSWSAGEWSPLLDARVDNPKYRHACRQLQNMVVLKQGGATRRPGTRYIAPAKYQDPDHVVRLMRFQFSPATSFILEFGDQYIRFYSNQQQVMSAGVPYEVATPYSGVNGSTWDAEVFQVTPCQINDVVYLTHPNYPPYKLTRFADTNWTMEPVNFLTPALLDQNTTNTTITNNTTAGVATLTAAAPAWATGHYYQVNNSVEVSSVIYNCVVTHVAGATFAGDLAAGKWEVATIFQSGHVGSTWQLAYLKSSNFVSTDITGNATSSTLEALGKWELHTYGVWSADIALERSFDGGGTWENVRTIAGRFDRNSDVTGTAVAPGTYRVVISNWSDPSTHSPVITLATTPRVVFEVVDAFKNNVVNITAVTDAYTATATNITPQVDTSATQYWSEAAWSGVRGYPRAVTSFQQRVIYGGSSYEPQRIWGSVTNDIENFDRGDGTLATSSWAFDLAAVGRGPIQWLLAQTDLFVGFSGAEWIVNSGSASSNGGSSGAAITAQAINAVEHSSWGSAPFVQPAIVGNALIYTQRAQRTMQQMLFSIYTQKYMSADLTSLSEHLFGAGIVQMDYQPQFRNQGIIWAVTKTRGLCGMTYQLEQEVFGWSRHVTGTGIDRGFESVAVVQGNGTQDDQVWVAVNRIVNGTTYRYIEIIDPTVWETAVTGNFNGVNLTGLPLPDIRYAFYVDAGITVFNPGSNTLSGLTHLLGRDVIGLINGNQTFGPLTVDSGGNITIPNYEAALGDVIQVGLPINYAVQAMRLDLDPRGGVVQGLTKALSKLYLRVFNSLGGQVSDGGAKAVPVNYRTVIDPLGAGPNLYTGEKAIAPFTGAFSNDPVYIIQGSDALPLTLLAVAVKYDISGSP